MSAFVHRIVAEEAALATVAADGEPDADEPSASRSH